MRILEYLQKTKWVSRRDMLEMINEKALLVNWNYVENINFELKKNDIIEVNLPSWEVYEEEVTSFPSFKPIIVAFNKPKGCVVSKADKHNKTIYTYLPKSWKKDFYYIWRLDKYSRWLLLLTNEPSLVDYYESPKSKILKIYEVKINKPFKTNHLLKCKKWFDVQDSQDSSKKDFLSFYDVKPFKDKFWKHYLRVLLTEWKNRHIRRMLEALDYKVFDLKRVKFWKYELWDIKPWKYQIHKIKNRK